MVNMGKLEELIEKRNLELHLEQKSREAEKDRKELELELSIKKRKEEEARENADSLNIIESIGLGILFGIIGGFIGLIVGGLIGFVIWLIYVIFGGNTHNETIMNIFGPIAAIIGVLAGFWMGFDQRREKM